MVVLDPLISVSTVIACLQLFPVVFFQPANETVLNATFLAPHLFSEVVPVRTTFATIHLLTPVAVLDLAHLAPQLLGQEVPLLTVTALMDVALVALLAVADRTLLAPAVQVKHTRFASQTLTFGVTLHTVR